jgi:pimeloyl-[acyl-carrier protein] methyl ester esterase
MSNRIWDDVTAWLVDAEFGVVTCDQRNCGQSSKDFSDVSISALGDDVVALCAQLELHRVVLNGWSLGGAVAIDAASKLGSRLAALISTCGATPRYTQADGFPHGGQAADVQATVAALRADRTNFLYTLYHDGVFAMPVTQAIKARTLELALQASPGADASLAALADIDQRSMMRLLDVPALVVCGDSDGVVDPAIGGYAADLLPQGKLVTLQGVGHAPFIEKPDEYRTAALGFLQRLV